MILNIFVIVGIGVVAYYHYTQGFFTATLSAIIAVIAAVVAVSYNETVVHLLLRGTFADDAHAMALVGIFAVTYSILRVIFDKAIPGNVRTPSTVDKVGAGLMGLIAGIFAAGIMAIAVQMMPFGPSLGIMMYSRYSVSDKEKVPVPKADNQAFDETDVHDRLDDPTLKDATKKISLWIPADELVMDTAYRLSDGALPGGRPMESIHPDYLTDLFTDRLGIQTGGTRSAVQWKGTETVKVTSVFQVPELSAYDGERQEIRSTGTPLIAPDDSAIKAVKPAVDKNAPPVDKNKPKPPAAPTQYTIKPPKSEAILIVRVNLTDQASADEGGMFRFSCGSIRLVSKVADQYVTYHPIGTMQGNDLALLNAPDDFLFVNLKERHGFDAVFVVDSSLVEGKPPAVAAETFISIKRYANIDLSGTTLERTPYKFSTTNVVYRKKSLTQALSLPDIKPEGEDDKKK